MIKEKIIFSAITVLVGLVILASPSRSSSYSVVVDYDPALIEGVEVGTGGGPSSEFQKWKVVRDGPEYKGKRRVQFELIVFSECLTYKQVLNELDKLGYRPANYPEAFAFDGEYHEYLNGPGRVLSIAALGTAWQGPSGDYAVAVIKYGFFRLDICQRDEHWSEEWCFLAVRK